MKFSKEFLFFTLLITTLTVAFFIYHRYFNSNKVVYVRTGEVINSFNGFKQAQKQFEGEIAIAKGNTDTLAQRLKVLRENIDLRKKSSQEWAYKVGKAENEFIQYQKNAEIQLQSRQQELSRNAISKINLFIEEYGKEKGYKLILGSTEDGSILYGFSEDDITKEIIEKLNKKYPADSLKK